MELKSLLAILSFSAISGSLSVGIALSFGIPTIAETVKDSQVELETIGIGNKQFTSANELLENYKKTTERNRQERERRNRANRSINQSSDPFVISDDVLDSYRNLAETNKERNRRNQGTRSINRPTDLTGNLSTFEGNRVINNSLIDRARNNYHYGSYYHRY